MQQLSAYAGTAPRLLKFAGILCVPACLLFLVAGSVAWAVNDPGLYRNGFQRYNTATRSGITDPDLIAIGAELRRYFNTGTEPLAVRAPIYGIEQDVFNEREIAHMYDVKRLVRGTYWVAIGSGLWVLATLAAGFAIQRREYVAPAARLAVWGGAVTLLAVVGSRVGLNRRLRPTVPAVPPTQLRQRPVDTQPLHRLPAHPVPRRLLVRRHHARRPDVGAGSGVAAVSRRSRAILPALAITPSPRSAK